MNQKEKENLMVIIGPTAVGKTALSLELARQFDAEIISGDSMQVYRGMDIGTAKATPEERAVVPHHLIDIRDPDEEFSVADFQRLAIPLITELNQKGKLPMIVGGTGLYIEAVTHQFKFARAGQDENIRHKYRRIAEEYGKEVLHQQLARIDPQTAERLHPNDVKRVIRALEIYELTGKTMSEYQERERESPYNLLMIGLTMERKQLYHRINQRVDIMMEQGLGDEVKKLLESGYSPQLTSMQGLGYKELVPYINGEIPLEDAVQTIKKRTRQFAKRQLSWFRRMKEVEWFDVTDRSQWDRIVENIRRLVAGKFF
ncbi:MAG: tRNA (adenosine(37)-N6)-dimethylallyltransferase MiaA [Bacillaceae bacterium]|nr:tRNA (adenosine(37)-N6)-dimethylallyltransferase MiaA [Bacillaceae bacterium]